MKNLLYLVFALLLIFGCGDNSSQSRKRAKDSDEKSEGVIRTIGNLFEYGVFNPMIDLYEYKGEKLLFEPNDQYNDLPIEISVKFVSYNNEPPYGTSEYFKLNPPMMKEVA